MLKTWAVVILVQLAICSFESAKAVTADEKKRDLQLQSQIVEQIFKDYNAEARPPPKEGLESPSVIIFVNAWIARARFQHNVAEMEITLRQEWHDSRLTYTPRLTSVNVPNSKRVWTPDTFFVSAEEIHKSTDKRFVRIESDGIVMYSQRYTVKVVCRNADSAYPLINQQVCTLKLGSYGLTTDDVVYFWRKSVPISVNEQEGAFGQYTFLESDAVECDANVTTGKYSCVEVDLTFDGPIHEPVVYIYLPSLLLLFCSWLHFWIHGSWTVPRTLSALLPFVLFVAALLFIKHPESPELTALEVWLAFCVLLTFLSLLEYFLCICFGLKRTYPGSDVEKPLLSDKETHDNDRRAGRGKCANMSKSTKLDCVCRLLFPLLFIVFVVLYLFIYLF